MSQQLKYCNRCGAHLAPPETTAVVSAVEKRLDEYLDGLFWITVFGLGLILGGMALMKKLQVSEGLIVAYMILSSVAFLFNFGLSLREVQRMKRGREPRLDSQLEPRGTKELTPPTNESLTGLPSVTEDTTRRLGAVEKEKVVLKAGRGRPEDPRI